MPRLPEQQHYLDTPPENYQKANKRFIADFESGEDGIDLSRANGFLEQYGLKPKKHVFFNEAETKKVRLMLDKYIVFNQIFSQEKESGAFIPEIDLVLVRRINKLEQDNGNIYTEGVYIHEQVHASGRTFFSHNDKTFQTVRSGQLTAPYKGSFFEEALAEYIKGQFILKHGEQLLENFKNKFSYIPKGTSLKDLAGVTDSSFEELTSYQIPLKYMHINNQKLEFPPSAIAAYSLENLSAIEPKLIPALLKGRQDVNGLRDVVKIVDSISPGLYTELRALDYDSKDFLKGLLRVNQVMEKLI